MRKRILDGMVLLTILSLLPSGLLHVFLGKYVYVRDLLLLGTTCCLCVQFRQTIWRALILPLSYLLGFLVLTIPLLFTSTIDGLVVWKQVMFWLFGILVGTWMADGWGRYRVLLCILVVGAYMVLEAAVGIYEIRMNTYFLEEAPEAETAFGVSFWTMDSLEEHARVKGLQRDPFTFGDLMTISGLFCAWSAWTCRGPLRILFAFGVLPFAYCSFLSTSRSAVIGFAIGILFLFIGITLKSRRVFRLFPMIVAVALIWVTLSGIVPFVAYVADHILRGSYIGNLESTNIRDEEWAMITREWIARQPLILVTGAPFMFLFDSNITPFKICDNQYLWLVYHTGMGGLLVVFALLSWPFFALKRAAVTSPALMLYFVFCGFLIGDSVAKEAMFYVTSVFVFMAYGVSAARQSRPAEHLPETRGEPLTGIAVTSDVRSSS